MTKSKFFNKHENLQSITTYIRPFLKKELIIVSYVFLFIFGITSRNDLSFYNEYRVVEVLMLLLYGFTALLYKRQCILKFELIFLTFIIIGSFFWLNPTFIITDLLLAYLLYKCFHFLNYQLALSKLVVIVSLIMFIQLPFALWDYVSSGVYQAIWYPLRWNIRVYDSYFLITSIFATWYYIRVEQYRYLYLLFLSLSFFAILLDGGRSATIAYSIFIIIVSAFYSKVRWQLITVYLSSWLAYFSVTYIANSDNQHNISRLNIVRESSSGRYELWNNALHCWSQNPIFGCGFYQLDKYPSLIAHPHNLFLQVLSETGLIGFGFLIYSIYRLVKRINWQLDSRYFVIAALLAVGVDMSLSGVHIYPVTQIALLWLLIFLFKNPEFAYTGDIERDKRSLHSNTLVSIWVFLSYGLIAAWFLYLFLTTQVFLLEVPVSPPRFWMYGYKL